MNKVFGLCLSIVLVCLAGWPGAAEAMTLTRIEISELTMRSDLIVEATALDKKSLWIDGTLFTRVSLGVQRTLKGSASERVFLLLPGGIDLDRPVPIAIRWPGAPDIAYGEDVLLFLRRVQSGPWSYYSIVGFSQGKLTILQSSGGSALLPGAGSSSDAPRSLASVEREILALVTP